jgi:hypothetical protein
LRIERCDAADDFIHLGLANLGGLSLHSHVHGAIGGQGHQPANGDQGKQKNRHGNNDF